MDSSYSIPQETVGQLISDLNQETFSDQEYRFFGQFLNDGVADNFIENIKSSGLSLRAKNSLIYWFNTNGRYPVSTSNQTGREIQFTLRAELSLLLAPCRRTDLDNPLFDYIGNLGLNHYHLQASNSVGPQRLGIRLFQRNSQVTVQTAEEQKTENKRKWWK